MGPDGKSSQMTLTCRSLSASSSFVAEFGCAARHTESCTFSKPALATGATELLKCFLSKWSCVVSGKYILCEKKNDCMLEGYCGYSRLNEMQSHLFFSKGARLGKGTSFRGHTLSDSVSRVGGLCVEFMASEDLSSSLSSALWLFRG